MYEQMSWLLENMENSLKINAFFSREFVCRKKSDDDQQLTDLYLFVAPAHYLARNFNKMCEEIAFVAPVYGVMSSNIVRT